MASDGTRVFVLGGYSSDGHVDEMSRIHVFDTSMCVRFVISSGQPSKLRTQRTSSTRNPRVTLSILMRIPQGWSSNGSYQYRLLRKLSGATVLHS